MSTLSLPLLQRDAKKRLTAHCQSVAATSATSDLTPVDVMSGDIISTKSVEGVVSVKQGDSDMTVKETHTTNKPGKSEFQSFTSMTVQ